MASKKYNVMALCLDVYGLRELIERMSVDNLGGCNDNPVMFELAQQFTEFMNGLPDDENAHAFHKFVPMNVLCAYNVTTCINGDCVNACMFTVCDLLGYGIFSHDNDRTAKELKTTLDAMAFTNGNKDKASDEMLELVSRHVASYAVLDGNVGTACYASEFEELKGTGYDVPPSSSNETINKAYLSMASDAVYRFTSLVLPYIKLYNCMDDYLLGDDVEDADD